MLTSTVRTYLELVRFSHTVFALPFAMIAVLIALAQPGSGDGSAWPRQVAGVLVCMVTARTAAMAFNRLVDRTIDAANPRTAGRHLPRGAVGAAEVMALVAASIAGFVAGTLLFLPNWLPLALSAPVLAWLLCYSYAKRFTPLAHAWLGVALGLAPVAAWIAIRGGIVVETPTDIWPALILGAAVSVWVAGFDTIYACQDAAFDAAHGLHSLPARLGVPRALQVAGLLHGLTVLLLACLPLVVPQLGPIYWGALAVIAARSVNPTRALAVKKASLTRDRSSGRTIACSHAKSAAMTARATQ
ncbi:MAG: 4-hydroxybenzoate octaprenyltransferase [Planctomycetia bacterium]